MKKRFATGFLLGVGLGGFLDGIVLHQILQWHNMLSGVLRPDTMDAMKSNMRADGLFHVAVWLATFAGVWMLWRDGHAPERLPTKRAFAGQMLLGWGAFNLIEGIIDHMVLNIHHVRDIPTHVPLYDWLFLAIGGVLFIVIGYTLSRDEKNTRAHTRG